MVAPDSKVDEFTKFVTEHELRLRESLIAACGGEVGRDAAAEALVYGWERWDRVCGMENPVGYLYKVGLSRGRCAHFKRHTGSRRKQRSEPGAVSFGHIQTTTDPERRPVMKAIAYTKSFNSLAG